MKSCKVLILIITIILLTVSCNEGVSTSSETPIFSAKTTKVSDSKAASFDYKTTYLFEKKILITDENFKLLSRTVVQLFLSDSETSVYIGTKLTDVNGVLNLQLSIPIHVKKLILKYKGNDSSITKDLILNRASSLPAKSNSIAKTIIEFILPSAHAEENPDIDGDGITNENDSAPEDPMVAQTSFFPSQCSYGTLGFEDLWPSKGDYDFNDLIINYNFAQNISASNEVTSMKITFQVVAYGAGYDNGFAIELPIASDKIKSVEGQLINHDYITLNSNGTEAGQSKAVIIVSDDISEYIKHFSNVYKGKRLVKPFEFSIDIEFNSGVTDTSLIMPPFNPFIIVDKNRGREVHLPDHSPTDLADTSYWKQVDDDSIPEAGRFYKDNDNKPWAIHIPVAFSNMIERKSITKGYKKFASWADSKGADFSDWYLGRDGYRDANYIIQDAIPSNETPLLSCEDPEGSVTVTVNNGPVVEEQIDTTKTVELSAQQAHYEDSYSTTVSFAPFDSEGGKKELIAATVSFDMTPSLFVVGKNIDGQGTASSKVNSLQTATLSWSNGTLADKSFSRSTDFSTIEPSIFQNYVRFLQDRSFKEKFPNTEYSDAFRGSLQFSGDDLAKFTSGEDIVFTLDHNVMADLAAMTGDNLSVDTNFRLMGTVKIKYMWRQFGTSGAKFNDPRLESLLRSELGVWSGGLTSTHCAGLTTLNLKDSEISDLKGLQICTDLEELTLSKNKLTNISTLSKLVKLRKLYLRENEITDISALSELTALTHLDLEYNSITDISPLSGLTNLKTLALESNEITSVVALKNLVNITVLDLSRNELTDITTLKYLAVLKHLYLRYNQISDASPLSGLSNLVLLYMRNNLLTDISWLVGLTEMRYLEFRNNNISSIPSLMGLTKLVNLYIQYNPLTSIAQLEQVKGTLQTLGLSGTNITDFTVLQKLLELKHLRLKNMTIDLMLIKDLVKLRYLILQGATLTNTQVISNFTEMVSINLQQTSITDVSFLENLSKLVNIFLYGNNIEDITFMYGKYESVQRLELRGNPISCASINTLWYYKYRKVRAYWNDDASCVITEVDPLTVLTSVIADANLDYKVRTNLNKMTTNLVASDLLALTTLNASGLQVTDLSGLQYAAGLATLNVSNNSISDFSDIASLPALVSIDLSDTGLVAIPDFQNMISITTLDISGTSVATISKLLSMASLQAVTLNNLTLPCAELSIVESLVEKGVAVTTDSFGTCETGDIEFIQSEESSTALIQHASSDLSSSSIDYSESSEQTLTFDSFDSQSGALKLEEVVITLDVVRSVSGLTKNFNSETALNGNLTVGNSITISSTDFALPSATDSLGDLSTTLSQTQSFTDIPMSTTEKYSIYRQIGDHASDFKEETLSTTEQKVYTFTSNLEQFSSMSEIAFKIELNSTASVASGDEGLLYDFDSSSDVTIKVEYKYSIAE